MPTSIDVSDLESVIGSLTAVKDRLMAGVKIIPGEDCHDWILEAGETLSEILDRASEN
jgi:hypothetical protein